jgi:hypothetical protein
MRSRLNKGPGGGVLLNRLQEICLIRKVAYRRAGLTATNAGNVFQFQRLRVGKLAETHKQFTIH